MTRGPEYRDVEKPLLGQLEGMGWTVTPGDVHDPAKTGRSSFREVLLKEDLRQALQRINLHDGAPWLDDARLSQAVSALDRLHAPRLLEANKAATELLIKGLTVEGLTGWDGGRDQTINFIDWSHPERNTYRAVNQFRVDCPSGHREPYVIPDVVLFVNGIPLVVIECKSPGLFEPLAEGIDQLRAYANQRHEIDGDEGNERLFYTNQILVATCFDAARFGTITAEAHHYLEWKTTEPVPAATVREDLGKAELSPQEKLAAGLLRPAHLVDVVRHFSVFHQVSGREVKIVCRYPQFRAVHRAVDRLLHGKTRAEDGESDRRGGLIWHTQGSGKSLTMVFLVRKMRSERKLDHFKIALVTDRNDLQRQLSDTVALTGDTIGIAKKSKDLEKLLRPGGADAVFATIQKYQVHDENDEPDDETSLFPVLNEDESILILADEAHRSHAKDLHANLSRALPNAARIGFTGTPILMGKKKRTHEIFGEYIDTYTLKESETDGATVPILYEGRTSRGAVADGRELDELFEDLAGDFTPEQVEEIKRKYGTEGEVREAEQMIAAKARDMLAHYVEHILPNRWKAQVVASSRRAAVRYNAALEAARAELLAAARALDDRLETLDDEALAAEPRSVQVAVRAHRERELLERLEFGVVISAGAASKGRETRDPPAWREWTQRSKIDARIEQFKKPFDTDGKNESPLAFLIVKSMLLTGFNAPVEAVMYLDRPIKEADLLQAIARVNRTGHGKRHGLVVDYHGIVHHLQEALAAYSAEDIEGAMNSLRDELPKLRDRHLRAVGVLTDRGADLSETEACIDLLKDDERLRAELIVKLKQFLATLDFVLPRSEALRFVPDAKRLAYIYARTRQRLKSGMPILGQDVGGKVRRLIDEHVVSLGVDPKIAPIVLTDEEFDDLVARETSPRAKASEMEHALRHHIRKHLDEDPIFYRRLSERLEEALKRWENRWEQQVLAFTDLIDEARQGRRSDDTPFGLDPATEAPFFAVLAEEMAAGGELEVPQAERLAASTRELVARLADKARRVGFWTNVAAQEELRGEIFQYLDGEDLFPFDALHAIVDQVMELVRANRARW